MKHFITPLRNVELRSIPISSTIVKIYGKILFNMFKNHLQSYLRFWARKYLNRVKPKVIAITGSVGKTSAKNAIFEVLRIEFGQNVRKSEGNLNTETGVPLAVLGFKKAPKNVLSWLLLSIILPFRIFSNSKTKILVLEFAADKPGDIEYLTGFIKPDIGVITSIGHSHFEMFGTLEKVIEEKTLLINKLPENGYAVINLDDENISKLDLNGNWQTKTFGIEKEADINAQNITTEIIDYKAVTKFQICAKERFQVELHTLGRETNIYPALIATAIADIFNISKDRIVIGLANIKSEKHRMEIFHGKNDSIILDDCYNASPSSTKAALRTLKVLPAKRKLAVLGDMLELGSIKEKAHKIIGEYSLEIVDEVLTYGKLAEIYGGKNFKSKEELINYLLSNIRENDIILIKASRGMKFEVIVDALKKE